ncbi:hypothetical protein N0V90_003929 [Kalmusia sp. IMI 367209]|nr:hypothetical protein N0V90_003929 [Kalmusia sp. IMI 367209]
MAEYWKSTPKYWCKFCRDYIKDTKFERQQHEATGRHQSNIQRSLKGLHREQAATERQKQRAKDEVARLNGRIRRWGKGGEEDDDVEALFKRRKVEVKEEEDGTEVKNDVKVEEEVKAEEESRGLGDIPTKEEAAAKAESKNAPVDALAKVEEAPAPAVVFKKRKKIAK